MRTHVAVLLALMVASARAATQTWSGASSAFWTNAANWTAATVPATGDDIQFNSLSTGNLATTLGGNFSIRSLAVADPTGAVSLASDGKTNVLTLGTAGFDLSAATRDLTFSLAVTLGASQTWNIAAGRTVNANGSMTAGAAVPLVKTGAGRVLLNANNTLSGGLIVNDGTVMTIGGQQNFRLQSGAQVTVNSGGTFAVGEVNAYNTGIAPTINAGGTMLLTNYNAAGGFHAHIGNLTINGGQMLGRATSPYAGEDCGFDANFTVTSGGTNLSYMSFRNGLDLIGTRTFVVSDATGDTNADLQIDGRVIGTGPLIKSGAGALLLTGTNTYTANTVVNGGSLLLAAGSTLSNSASIVVNTGGVFDVTAGGTFFLAANQTLQGFGGTVAGSVTLQASSKVIPGGASGIGTLTIGNGLTLPGASTNTFDFGGGLHDVLDVNGLLTVTGDVIAVNALTLLTNGTYTIINYGTKSGSFNPAPVHSTRKTVVVDESVANQINLVVSGGPGASLRWNSTNSPAWDVAASTNWLNTGTLLLDAFWQGDDVLFDDTAGVTTSVTLATTVVPASVTVDAGANNFTISGAGKISGTAGLTKSGTGTLTIATANDFTGPVLVSNGVVKIGLAGALGNAAGVTVNSGAQVNLNGIAQAANNYAWTISGAGPDGGGAIVNANVGIVGSSTVRYLTLAGDAAVGANGPTANENGRFDIGSGGWIQGNGYTLTKVGSNVVVLKGGVTNIQLAVQSGMMGLEVATSSITNILVNPGAYLSAYGALTLVSPVVLNGGTLSSHSGGGACTWAGPVTLVADSYLSSAPGVYGYGTENVIVSGSIGGPGRLTAQGGGTIILTGTNTYGGGTLVSAGNLQIGNGGSAGSVVGAITDNGTLYYALTNAFTLSNPIAGTGSVYLRTPGGMTIDGSAPVSIGGTLLVGRNVSSTLILTNGASVMATNYVELSGDAPSRVLIYPGATLATYGNIDLGNEGADNSPCDLTQFGGAVASLNAGGGETGLRIGHWDNEVSYYRMQGGTLTVTSGTSRIYLGIDGIGILDVQGGVVNAREIDVDGRGNTGALNGTNETLILTGGRINLGGGGLQTAGSGNVFLGGGTMGALTNWSSPLPIQLTGTNGPVQFDPAGFTITMSGALTGTGGVVVTSAGTLWLSATNQAFTGGSAVNAGSLVLNGALAAPLMVGTNGTLALGTPGLVSGGLTLPALALGGDATARIPVGTNGPLLRVTGTNTLSIAGTNTLALAALPGLGTFPVIDYTGTVQGVGVAGLGLAPLTGHGGTAVLVDNTTNTTIDVVISSLGSLRWLGTVNGTWDINLTTNWQVISDLSLAAYLQVPASDLVLFDDAASVFNVTIPAAVSPLGLSVSNNANDYTIGGAAISGLVAPVKYGNAKLTLTGTNTFTGSTSVNGGTLAIVTDTSLGAAPGAFSAGALMLASGTTLEVLNTMTLNGNRGITVGPASGSGTATVSVPAGVAATANAPFANNGTGTGALVKTGSGTLYLNAANTIRGGLTVNAGAAIVIGSQAGNRLPGGSQVTVNNGGTFVYGEVNAIGTAASMARFAVNAGGTLLLTNYNGAAGFHAHFGVIDLNGGQMLGRVGAGAYNGEDCIIEAGGTITVGGTNASYLSFANALDLGGAISFVVNDATGDTNVDAQIDGKVFGSGPLVKSGSGKLLLTGTNAYTAGATLSGGVIAAGSDAALGSGTLTMAGGTLMAAGGSRTIGNAVSATAPSFIDTSTGDLTMGGTMSGASTLTKRGNGTLTLVGTNTQNASLIVNVGTLLVNGTGQTGPVTVDAGATLGGTGVVRGLVSQNGILSPGTGIGTLTISNQVSCGGASATRFELGGTNSYDQLIVSDLHILNGTLEVVTTNGYVPVSGDRFNLITNTAVGGLLFGPFPSTSLPALPSGMGWDVQYSASDAVSLVVTGSVYAPTPYEAWAAQIPNPSDRSDQMDPDNDGYANLLEYSQGSDPTNNVNNAKLNLVRTNGMEVIVFNRVNTATDIVYEVQASYAPTNNAEWLGLATNSVGSWGSSTNVNDDNTATIHRVWVSDLEIGTNRSLRLKITRP